MSREMEAKLIVFMILWITANIYLIRNRRAVAKLLRGYGAYEVWKMKEWIRSTDDIELADINETCIVYEIKE